MHYSLTRATIWNLAGYLYLLVAALVSTPILVRSLGLAEFSRYGLIVATLTLVSSLNLGLPQAVVRSLSLFHAQKSARESIWATSSILFILTGLVASIIGVIVSYFIGVTTILYPLIFALVLISYVVSHYQTLPHAEGHFGYYNTKTFVVGTANTYLAAYLAYHGHDILIILLFQLVAYLLSLLVLVYFSLKFFPRLYLLLASFSQAKTLLSFGLKNQLGTLVGQIQAQYAKFMLAAFNPLLLSAYLIASGLVQKAAGGVVQLATALYPATSRGSLSTQFAKIYRFLQVGLLALGIMGFALYQFWGLALLTWWLNSPDLVQLVHSVLKILVIYLIVLVLNPLPSVILDGRGRPELTSLFATITVVIEIILALILLPTYGILAPAYSALIAVSLTTPLLLLVTSRMLQSKP